MKSNQAKHFDFAQCKHVHFIGIGGIGMSALARMLVHRGVTVSGSDSAQSELTKTLENEGMSITYQQAAENINKQNNEGDKIDFVVYTDAMSQDSEELVAARELGVSTVSYFEALGEIAKEYKVIAIAGTHGKTTTTAMTAQALIAAGIDPTVIVGSLVDFNDESARSHLPVATVNDLNDDATRTNFRAGKSEYLLVEACEYRRHFLHFNPYILAVTNIELDHPDYYKDLADVEDVFAELASQSETVLAPESIQKHMLSVPELKVPGEYNRENAALALAIVNEVIGDEQTNSVELRSKAKDALENFQGTWRRFEYKGKTKSGAEVYDDYAHHPTAIKEMLKGAREKFGNAKIIVVFEPHTYTRTGKLMSDFAKSFGDADEVIIAPIYAAREESIEGVTAKALAQNISKYNKKVQSTKTLEQAVELVESLAKDGDILIFMGAGDIYRLVDSIIQK